MLEQVSRQQKYLDISKEDFSDILREPCPESEKPHFRAFGKTPLEHLQRAPIRVRAMAQTKISLKDLMALKSQKIHDYSQTSIEELGQIKLAVGRKYKGVSFAASCPSCPRRDSRLLESKRPCSLWCVSTLVEEGLLRLAC
jgi:hypothetical protein